MPQRFYSNPVLNADWSDPDVIRVDGDFYLTASSFNRVPGLPILHSRDLVEWNLIGHALERLTPEDHFALPRHGAGVWAPTIRYRDGIFYIFYPDPDHGIYVVTASDPAGPWSAPHLLYAGRGLIDPCPFWDDDGKAYLAHAWAKTRAGFWNRITMLEMAPDASRIIGAPATLIEGEDLPGFIVLEGPKIYKREGWYWVFAPAGTVPIGWQSVFRSQQIWGPYEERTVLAQGTSSVNGPHQGAWVTDVDDQDWFVHFQDRGAFGRVVHLQPMGWGDDGWPRMGTNAQGALGTRAGEPVLRHPVPAGSTHPERPPRRWGGALPPHWHWQANPGSDWLVEHDDRNLVLSALPNDTVNLREIPQVLGHRVPGVASTTCATIGIDNPVAGTRAGIVVLGKTYFWIGVRSRAGGVLALEAATGGFARVEEIHSSVVVEPDARVTCRVSISDAGIVTASWRVGESAWNHVGHEFTMTPGMWIGAEVGLFATSPVGTEGDLPKGLFEDVDIVERGEQPR
ncbi:MAG: family 43 glycosylhydrolase [Microcella sp.]|uniref:glycoside hydrolase family 43 protein n=1 Tax=Microcella sp. TaxID=1913979 RepID=UPI0024C9E6FE|nr:glycoside hydrolase 43 family protein [Microcella sp.]UYN82518.1 MAG: family 43 glycosylhydrolase [Microcella sp.]